jgi:hypothetical protein
LTFDPAERSDFWSSVYILSKLACHPIQKG